MSVAAMGVYPYITASIVMQLLVPLVPTLQALSKEGEQGRKQINIYTHWLTVPMAFVQGYGQLIIVQSQGGITGIELTGPNALPTFSAVITMTAGTMFLVWIGELISEKGIGNGISVLIFAGIVAGIPQLVGGRLYEGIAGGLAATFALAAFLVGLVAFIVLLPGGAAAYPGAVFAQRVQIGPHVSTVRGDAYPTQGEHDGDDSADLRVLDHHLPGVRRAGVLSFEQRDGGRASATSCSQRSTPSNPFYWLFVFVVVIAFTFFYTVVVFQQQNLAENLQRQGGFIPGIRPGRPTEQYINRVLMRITGEARSSWVLLRWRRSYSRLCWGSRTDGRQRKRDDVRDHCQRHDHRRRCRPGYDAPDRGAAADAPVRRLHQVGAASVRSPPRLARSGQRHAGAAISERSTGLVHISTGELFRENIGKGTELGKKAQEYVNSGRAGARTRSRSE